MRDPQHPFPAPVPHLARPTASGPRRRRFLLPFVACATLAAAPLVLAPAVRAATAEPRAIDAPITAVTVYSDRARVTRTATLTLTGGAQRVVLPILAGSVDPGSILVEAQGGADVQHIEIGRVEASELPLPVSDAEKLLRSLDQLDDQLTRVQAENQAYRTQASAVTRMLPAPGALSPQGPADLVRPPPRLTATGWPGALQFVRQSSERLHAKIRETDELLRKLRQQRQDLVEKARQLGGLTRRAGYRVTPTLHGAGPVTVTLTYMTTGARWLPAYDIQLQPADSRVELSLAGLVSQETGEDWTDVALTLSTAVPATATQLPKLRTWKIGERERFVPTPAPQRESAPPPPRMPPSPPAPEADPTELLRLQLLARTGLINKQSKEAEGRRVQMVDALRESTDTRNFRTKDLADRRGDADGVPDPEPESPVSPAPPAEPQTITGDEMTVNQKVYKPVDRAFQSISSVAPGYAGSLSEESESLARIEIVGVGIAPPPGYVPPRYDPTLPAALAGGYDLVYPGLAKDTVRSGPWVRRVAVLSRSFPVAVSRKVLPALAPEAFLVAEIKNPSSEPLPGGEAHLFVGADPAGVARLRLVAPGEAFTLPLGLDHAIRPLRNVQMTTVEKGVFSKDELTEYVVKTELVNPYKVPVDLRLYDQIPLIGDKNVEIKLVRTDPVAVHDEKKGSLEWRINAQPGQKITTTFVYSLRRPKGYRLNQAQ